MWILWEFYSWIEILGFGCFFFFFWIQAVYSPGMSSLCYISMLKILSQLSQQLLEKRRDSVLHVPRSLEILLPELDLWASWNTCTSFPNVLRKGTLSICQQIMPCQFWASCNCKHGENHSAFFTVADDEVHSGSHWPFLKRYPGISRLQMPLSKTTQCWSGSRSMMLLFPANLQLALLFFRFQFLGITASEMVVWGNRVLGKNMWAGQEPEIHLPLLARGGISIM